MLINCVAYQNGQKLADIDIADISDWLAKPDCFIWVAMRDASMHELEAMQEEFDLHPLAIEDAARGHQRPKIEEYGETVFIVMQLLEMHEARCRRGKLQCLLGAILCCLSGVAANKTSWVCASVASVSPSCSSKAQALCRMP